VLYEQPMTVFKWELPYFGEYIIIKANHAADFLYIPAEVEKLLWEKG